MYDTIVIGAGGVGSSALYHLASQGQRVLGIDRFAPPHDRGSSHGQTRAIRQAYFEHPDYVPLLQRTYALWRTLESQTGAALFEPCGMVEIGPANGEVIAGVLRAAREHELAVESLDAAEVLTRWPALRVPEGLAAVYEPTAGYLHVERCVEVYLSEARKLGAELLTDCEVKAWRAALGEVEVETPRGTFVAQSLVITAGAWASDLLASLGIPLAPLRKSLFWYPADLLTDAKGLPVYLYELPQGVYYGFPATDGQIKIGEHSGGQAVSDPLAVDRNIRPEEQRGAEAFLAQCLPGVVGPPVAHTTCLYTMTPDHHFVVDRHPEYPNVAFAAGLSGHGFKFTPVLGEVLADLLTEGKTELPIGFLSFKRFHAP